ncbi:MAG TPA: NYN domain-containing protein [Anaerolineae bacterium]|nr:NYN domain-containing protein [Anaerolineae bacterium]
MPFLIDGHNLIASLPDIQLRDPDDEARLIERLSEFCAHVGKEATVYFDRSALGLQEPVRLGSVTARFVSEPQTADQAIASHLRYLGGEASNWTVVSSDHAVQRAAKHAGARVLSSREFSHLLQPAPQKTEKSEKPSAPDSEEEIAAWEQFFRKKR